MGIPDDGQKQDCDRRASVEAILLKEDTLMGRIDQYGPEGKTPAEIAAAEDNQTPRVADRSGGSASKDGRAQTPNTPNVH